MGLDWIPADVPKSGCEVEFDNLRKKIAWGLPFVTSRWKKRYDEIAISPWDSLGELPLRNGEPSAFLPALPQFSHAGDYAGIDETSFRGEFVLACQDLISEQIQLRAYSPFTPSEAIDYGKALYDRASEIAVSRGLDPASAKGDPDEDPRDSIEGQIEVFRSASEWFVFWGQKGHGIRRGRDSALLV